jgi:hypothetical protein
MWPRALRPRQQPQLEPALSVPIPCAGRLEHAGSILQDHSPELHISRRRLRQAESIRLVRDRRNAANQQLCLPTVCHVRPAREVPSPFDSRL